MKKLQQVINEMEALNTKVSQELEPPKINHF